MKQPAQPSSIGASTLPPGDIARRVSVSRCLVIVAAVVLFLSPTVDIGGGGILGRLDGYVVFALLIYWLVSGSHTKELKISLFLIFLPTAYLLLLHLFFPSSDFEGVRRLLTQLFGVVASYALALALVRLFGDAAMSVFLKLVVLAAILQGAALYGTYFFDGFRDWLDAVFYRDLSPGREHLTQTRATAFSPSGGDGLALNLALLVCVGTGLRHYIHGPWGRFCLWVFLLVTLFGTLLTARTGFIVGGVAIAVASIRTLAHRGAFQRCYPVVAIGLLGLVAIIVITAAPLGRLGSDLLEQRGHNDPIVRALEPHRRWDATGTPTLSSGAAILRGISVLPHSNFTLLFGSAEFGRQPQSYVPSDVGYVRMLYGVGILGTLLYLAWFVYAVLHLSRACDHRHLALLLSALVVGVLGHVKIIYLQTQVFTYVFGTLFFLLCLCHIPGRPQGLIVRRVA